MALFRLGNKIEISTIQGNERVTFTLDYAEIKKVSVFINRSFRKSLLNPIPKRNNYNFNRADEKQGYPLDNYVGHLSRYLIFRLRILKSK
ncbi:Uncharacterised protein [Neisseria gonorrhoeae]|uniref:Uncharacterized protein n=1 Tax=Neisseria gonorrhoeae TaxID=485 RepID=A0A378VXH5_NEIGO|nr:Uncharacterised protein [Neisseria gonorrhoeae]